MFRFKSIDEVIREKIDDMFDLVIEGGIGHGYTPSGFYLFQKFRKNGYRGPYVGVDLIKQPKTVPTDLIYLEKTDCMEPNSINPIAERYKSENPVFVTNCCEGIFFDSHEQIDKLLQVTCEEIVYNLQLHRQFGGFDSRLIAYLTKRAKEEHEYEVTQATRDVISVEEI